MVYAILERIQRGLGYLEESRGRRYVIAQIVEIRCRPKGEKLAKRLMYFEELSARQLIICRNKKLVFKKICTVMNLGILKLLVLVPVLALMPEFLMLASVSVFLLVVWKSVCLAETTRLY